MFGVPFFEQTVSYAYLMQVVRVHEGHLHHKKDKKKKEKKLKKEKKHKVKVKKDEVL